LGSVDGVTTLLLATGAEVVAETLFDVLELGADDFFFFFWNGSIPMATNPFQRSGSKRIQWLYGRCRKTWTASRQLP
jgi:hypothetical protein